MIISDDILFPRIISWENLWQAYHKAARGKRGKMAAAAFEFQIADRLLALQAELTNGTYQPGAYRHFTIHTNKHKASYRPDGSVRIVVAHNDPGVPNWINTVNHESGTM